MILDPLTKSPTLENLPPLPSSLHLLYGNPNMISKIQKEPKIVFYVLSPSSGNHKIMFRQFLSNYIKLNQTFLFMLFLKTYRSNC